MRFICLFKPARRGIPPPEEIAKMGQFIEELKTAGILLATDGVQPGGKTARVRMSNRKFTVMDGPFAEAKELIGGYAVLQVKSMEQLYDVSRRFLEIAGDGESEIVQMYVAPAQPCPDLAAASATARA
jgi:hypothetical protein